jgi:hypothetical protein
MIMITNAIAWIGLLFGVIFTICGICSIICIIRGDNDSNYVHYTLVNIIFSSVGYIVFFAFS